MKKLGEFKLVEIPSPSEERSYHKISMAVEAWLELHTGETFDLDLLCRQLEIREPLHRNYTCTILSKLISKGKLEKNNRTYKTIDYSSEVLDWVNADDKAIFPLVWPVCHEDGTEFKWDNVQVSPGDLIVIGGETNKGKTLLVLNLLWDNMDAFPCTLMGNAEYSPGKFKRRTSRMTWANPRKEDGSSKFDLIRVRTDWQYKIRPDNINLIDWISLEGDFYRIGKLLEAIKDRLKDGLAVVSLQKGAGATQAVGGHFTEDSADVYITMQDGHLTLKKVKEWSMPNPNGTMWAYDIIEGGTQFSNIREVKKCPNCWGSGHKGAGECDRCHGKGVIDKE